VFDGSTQTAGPAGESVYVPLGTDREGQILLRHAVIAVAVAVAFAVPPALADELADGIAAMPGGVEDVRIGGTWQADGKSGVYRIVIARSGGNAITARLFVQWIAYGETGEATVEHTMEITEFDKLNLDIVDYNSESDAEGLSVYIEAIDPEGGASEQFELFVFGPDDYRFGPATN
jgi:hypothetical protein